MDYSGLKRNQAALQSLTRGRIDMLNALKGEAEAALRELPRGKLRVSMRNGRPYYYLRERADDKCGRYIRRAEQDKAAAIAQRAYYEEVLAAAGAELEALERLDLGLLDDISCLRKSGIARLVHPIYPDDAACVRAWEALCYTGKPFDGVTSHFYTARGERVRSKSESIIADALNRHGVPYRYECPLVLPGLGTVYPDFTCLNLRLRQILYLEHFGMMDDPDYAQKAMRKVFYYKRGEQLTGNRLIFLTETRDMPLDTREVESLIRKFLL